jgi:hypothetical protein
MNQKEIAIQCLKKLDIYKPYIRKFEKEDMPTFFERCAGFYLFNEPVLQAKVKEVEKEYGVLVYALTHEWFEFGECWSLLCVSKSTESIDDCLMDASRANTFYVYAYVWNQDHDALSEFGDVIVQSTGGGLRRLG